MTPMGRATLAKSTLSAIPVHTSICCALSPWVIKEIDRRRRAFIWAGADTISGGKCKVAWPTVCMPKDLGGLGLSDLSTLGVALRLRWEWLRRSDPSAPWAQLTFKMDAVSEAMFSASVRVVIGDGTRARFWTDNWLPNGPICLQAPSLFRAVGSRRRGRSVRDALLNGRSRRDITDARTMAVISEFAAVRDICRSVVLHPGVLHLEVDSRWGILRGLGVPCLLLWFHGARWCPGSLGCASPPPRSGFSFDWRFAAGSGRQREGCATVYSPARTAPCAAKLRRQSIICSPPASSPEKFGSTPSIEPTCSSLRPGQPRVSVSGGSRQGRRCPRLFGVPSTAWFCWCLGNSGRNETAEPSTESTNRPPRCCFEFGTRPRPASRPATASLRRCSRCSRSGLLAFVLLLL